MKKLLTILMLVGFSFHAFSQEDKFEGPSQTAKGKVAIDVNTTLGSIGGVLGGSGTSFLLSSSEGSTIYNFGAEVGIFAANNMAFKLGFAYGDFDGFNLFSYKLGLKYYIISRIPFQIDFNGQAGKEIYGDEKAAYIGLQAGYAIFIGDMVS